MPCPACGRTSACLACLDAKQAILEAASAGKPVLRIRANHVAVHGNSAALCGARGLPLSDHKVTITTIPAGCCPACITAARVQLKQTQTGGNENGPITAIQTRS